MARTGVTVIPVVVHVVYNGAAQNISDAQIQSQIDVLNRDFRKTNADVAAAAGVFQPLAADARDRVLPGHDRSRGQPDQRHHADLDHGRRLHRRRQGQVGATGGADAWPRDNYLNIWVCRLGGGLLGYAQFPGGPPRTDGVVILHTAFGTTGTAAAPFNLGRTATHEIGHWLNLRHIWGDDGTGCSGDDFVADTPNAAGPNFGMPAFPHVTCSNGPERRHVHELHGLHRRRRDVHVHRRPGGAHAGRLDGDRPTLGHVKPAAREHRRSAADPRATLDRRRRRRRDAEVPRGHPTDAEVRRRPDRRALPTPSGTLKFRDDKPPPT